MWVATLSYFQSTRRVRRNLTFLGSVLMRMMFLAYAGMYVLSVIQFGLCSTKIKQLNKTLKILYAIFSVWR